MANNPGRNGANPNASQQVAAAAAVAAEGEEDELPPYDIQTVARGDFSEDNRDRILLGSPSSSPSERVAIRVRRGPASYSEWLSELQVYLLPNFKHKNVLEFYDAEACQYDDSDDDDDHDEDAPPQPSTSRGGGSSSSNIEMSHLPRGEPRPGSSGGASGGDNASGRRRRTSEEAPCRAEYWLATKYYDYVTLRDYLRANTIDWTQLLKITKGLMRGLYFLHENHDYQNFNTNKVIESFVDSTNGALKLATFYDIHEVIHMKPYLQLTIIHRNLTSRNIVVKPDMTPCIWNFSAAYVHHPFQPTNHRHLIDAERKRIHLTSHYSAPEVIQERGHMTLASMKSIDMYASGIIMWELMSRCVLPKLRDATEEEDRERSKPDVYYEPFEREIGHYGNHLDYTNYLVCRKGIRPRLKASWLIGKKTSRYVQTMRELWDPDYDARLLPATVLSRMKRLSSADRDRRNRFVPPLGRVFAGAPPNWQDSAKAIRVTQAPVAAKTVQTLVFDTVDPLPNNNTPGWILIDSEEDYDFVTQCQPSTSRQADDSRTRYSSTSSPTSSDSDY